MKNEVEDADDIHSLQLIVPFSTGSLLANGEGGIIQTAVLEKLLLTPLHLHQNLLPLLVLTIHVENSPPVILLRAQVFGVQIGHVLDNLLAKQQRIEKTHEQFLVHVCAEQQLESEVGVRINVAVLKSFSSHNLFLYK